jgi:hypothetical protein
MKARRALGLFVLIGLFALAAVAALAFNFALADGTTLVGLAKIDGDKMAGQWDHPEGSSAPWTFERKK